MTEVTERGNEEAGKVPVYTLDDPVRGRPPLEVHGEQIASVSTREPGRDRWNTLDLYELPESGDFLLYRAGLSITYHRGDTACTMRSGARSGEPCTIDDLPTDARPCRDCRPLRTDQLADLADAGEHVGIRFEVPRISINRGDPAQIVERLESTWSRDTGSAVRIIKLSKPAAELIAKAMQASSRFADGIAGLDLDGGMSQAPRRIA